MIDVLDDKRFLKISSGKCFKKAKLFTAETKGKLCIKVFTTIVKPLSLSLPFLL